ncbi:hypothetical protein E3P99_01998 [Wallemia hederae]|uniref:PUM-HD domain-containing protein n=1 Tax=Wallemia hederae TaxID=1540922 RepID=A0A4V4LTH8_9BASI|nr:hypothetical protein E3P99_01998 [Wallemia hederae]
MQNDDVIDWADDGDDDGDIISLGGSDDEKAAATQPKPQLKDGATNTDINAIHFDGPALANSWIIRISSQGEPYFYNNVDKKSLWRCPGYTQPVVASSSSSEGVESSEKKRRLSSQKSTGSAGSTSAAATPARTAPTTTQRVDSEREQSQQQEKDARDLRQQERIQMIEKMERDAERQQQQQQQQRQPRSNSRGGRGGYSDLQIDYQSALRRRTRIEITTDELNCTRTQQHTTHAFTHIQMPLSLTHSNNLQRARRFQPYDEEGVKKKMATTATTLFNKENKLFQHQPTIKHKKSKQFLTPFNDSSNVVKNGNGNGRGLRHYASTSFINQPQQPALTQQHHHHHPQQHVQVQHPQASPTYAYFPLHAHAHPHPHPHAHTSPLDPYAFPEPNYLQSPSPTATTFADFTRFIPPPPPPQQQNSYLMPSSPSPALPHVYPVRTQGLQHKHSMPTLGGTATPAPPMYENYLYAHHTHTPPQPPPPQLHYQPPQTRMRSMRSNQHLQSEFKSTNRSAVLEDFRVNGKHTKPELHNIFGYVTEFATDQLGSRFIQQKLNNASPESFGRVFEEIFPNTVELSSDVFGNYVIQKLFEHGTSEQRTRLINKIKDNIPTLSFQMYGCRVVQKAVECVEEDEKTEIVNRVETITDRAVQDQNANHVIQRIIERVDGDKLLSFPITFAANAKELATHPYGCRVLQRCFEHIGQARSRPLIEELHEHVDNLVVDMFGNYVIQYLLEFGNDGDRSRIIVKINQRFFELARHKFASNVCEKALIKAEDGDRQMLINRLIDRSDDEASVDGIPSLMKDQYGNYVLQRAISVVSEPQAELLILAINEELDQIRKTNQIHNMSSATAKHVLAIERLLSQQLGDEDYIHAHVAALHFENSVEGGRTIKLRPGKVWFTLEVKIDTGKKSQYSATKSAITIGIISLASIATVAAYGAPAAIAASGAAAAGGTAAAAGTSTAAGTSAGAGAAKFFSSQSANIAKLSSYLIGKSAKKVSKEYGGMSAVQEEVVSIVKSPNVDSITRNRALAGLAQLGRAWKEDKQGKDEEEQRRELERVMMGGDDGKQEVSTASTSSQSSLLKPPPYDSLTRQPSFEDRVTKDTLKENGGTVRVHGLYVKERMELEVRVVDGALQIKDKVNDKVF